MGLDFDHDAWLERLYAANPWARGLAAPRVDDPSLEKVALRPELIEARRQASVDRVNDIDTLRQWAEAMAGLAASLPKAEAPAVWAIGPEAVSDAPALDQLYALCATIDLSEAKISDLELTGVTFPGQLLCEKTVFAGTADFADCRFLGPVRFDGATFVNVVKFSGSVFTQDAWFRNAEFKRSARFSRVAFKDAAWFHGARFQNARFHGAVFDGDARLQKVHFGEDARFERCAFAKSARFSEAVFAERAVFQQAEFKGFSDFQQAKFQGEADFTALHGREGAAFDFEGASFKRVPNFMQAHFPEAPRLDNVSVTEAREEQKDPDLPARWRNLKRLAIQGHDHVREMDFFAGEMLALRRSDYAKRGYWLKSFPSYLYQWFSDFGRSSLRPVLWWVFLILVFTGVNYAGHHMQKQRDGVTDLAPLACVTGPGDALSAAASLAWTKGLIGGLGGGSLKTAQDYACLYGIHGVDFGPDQPRNELPEQFTPVIPGWIAFAGGVQLVLSTALIFLFLLALRNQFRIR